MDLVKHFRAPYVSNCSCGRGYILQEKIQLIHSCEQFLYSLQAEFPVLGKEMYNTYTFFHRNSSVYLLYTFDFVASSVQTFDKYWNQIH